MNGIVISIDPVIFQLGAFELRWYGVAVMLAIVAGVLISAYLGQKKGIAKEEIYSLAPWVVIGGLLGTRLFHVIDYLEYYLANPWQIFGFEGLAIWGGVVGGGAATIVYARIRHIPLGRLVDAMAPALLTGQMIGRIGCIIDGHILGGVTDLPWGFIYTHPDALIPAHLLGVPIHPYPLYEIMWNAMALLVILRLSRHFTKDGLVFLSYLSLYSLGRFFLTFVRVENVIFWGLQQSQLVAIVMLIAAVAMFIYLARAGNGVATEIGRAHV